MPMRQGFALLSRPLAKSIPTDESGHAFASAFALHYSKLNITDEGAFSPNSFSWRFFWTLIALLLISRLIVGIKAVKMAVGAIEASDHMSKRPSTIFINRMDALQKSSCRWAFSIFSYQVFTQRFLAYESLAVEWALPMKPSVPSKRDRTASAWTLPSQKPAIMSASAVSYGRSVARSSSIQVCRIATFPQRWAAMTSRAMSLSLCGVRRFVGAFCICPPSPG
ncbi:hypothetical protein SAMN03159290_02559 [Pseudomonas sp. NFACC13-1]|nr:hypothetical protein SAMN03159290_02559 [Pseudomonas sp. NFACC13-1]